jgi:hypothetical protein
MPKWSECYKIGGIIIIQPGMSICYSFLNKSHMFSALLIFLGIATDIKVSIKKILAPRLSWFQYFYLVSTSSVLFMP